MVSRLAWLLLVFGHRRVHCGWAQLRFLRPASDNSRMVDRIAFFAAALLLVAACDKGESAKTKVATQDDAHKAPSGAGAAPAVDAAPGQTSLTERLMARTAPPGWKTYSNLGYSVVAPPAPPQDTDFGDSAELQGLTMVGQEFRFADCFGQVLRLQYGGTEDFDIEKGLDGGIEKMLLNIGATKTYAGTESDEGRIARQYRVDGAFKGIKISGMGRGIAADDKTVVIINAFWKAADTTCPELGEFFVKSLTVDSK